MKVRLFVVEVSIELDRLLLWLSGLEMMIWVFRCLVLMILELLRLVLMLLL